MRMPGESESNGWHKVAWCNTFNEGEGYSKFFIKSRVTINKINSQTYDEIIMDDETYDEVAMKIVSKCLACIKGYWDPEFKPSVQEIMNYRSYIMVILSVGFLWRAHTLGDFPIPSSTWQVKVQVQVNRLKPHAPIVFNTEDFFFFFLYIIFLHNARTHK